MGEGRKHKSSVERKLRRNRISGEENHTRPLLGQAARLLKKNMATHSGDIPVAPAT